MSSQAVTGLPRFIRGFDVEFWIGLAVILTFSVAATFGQRITPFDPYLTDFNSLLQPPSPAHWFGTDMFGRDVFSRVVMGARIDLVMGVVGVILPMTLGTLAGLIAGYGPTWLDSMIMRIVDLVLAFPWLILMMAIIAITQPGLVSFFLAITIVGWVSYARLVRAETLKLRGADFIKANRVLGYSNGRILLKHILPNAIIPALVYSASDIVLVIGAGSAMSYLGMGVQSPAIEWGLMISDGKTFITTAWWIPFFPGLAIVILALGFSLFADALSQRFGGVHG